MRTIGLMGGMGWEGSAAYYRIMNREVRARLGGLHSARVILDSLEFDAIARAQASDDFKRVRSTLVASAVRLEQAGAEMLVIACNTVHRFADAVQQAISIPLLHIADPAGQALRADGHRRVGLLGTQATMGGSFYSRRLAEHFGLEVVPPSRATQAAVHGLIFDHLAQGHVPPTAVAQLDAVAAELAAGGCTAVLLGCTEFGLVYGGSDRARFDGRLPLYDTTVLHALGAVDAALRPS